jgi:hypothetical protein
MTKDGSACASNSTLVLPLFEMICQESESFFREDHRDHQFETWTSHYRQTIQPEMVIIQEIITDAKQEDQRRMRWT